MRTPLCDLLGIEYPVVLAGMAGGMTTPELVAAVGRAGGLGTFGAAGMSIDALVADVRRAKELADAPVGVNVLLGSATPPRGDLSAVTAPKGGVAPPSAVDLAQAALEAGARVLCTGLGDPAPIMDCARAAGAPVVAMVASVDDARRAEQSGADILVAQGGEAGGHRSNFSVREDGTVPLVGTMALVPQVVDAVGVPVIAAGGIMDGRGMAAALALGAQGVQLGTRFLTTEEAGLARSYKQRVQAAREDETVVTSAISGRPARGIRNRLIDELESAPVNLGYPRQQALTGPARAAGMKNDDPERIAMWAGQAAGLATPGSAADVVAEIVSEARLILRDLAPKL